MKSTQIKTLNLVLKITLVFYLFGLLLVILSIPIARQIKSKQIFEGFIVAGTIISILCSMIIMGIYFAGMYFKVSTVFLMPYVMLVIFDIAIISLLTAYIMDGTLTVPILT